MSNATPPRGEMIFRLCAVGVSGLLFILVQIVLFLGIILLGGLLLPKQFTLAELTFFFAVFSLLPSLLGWFLVFVLPLKKSGATVGMRLFGLQVRQMDGTVLTWKRVWLREGVLVLLAVTGVALPITALLAALNKSNYSPGAPRFLKRPLSPFRQ